MMNKLFALFLLLGFSSTLTAQDFDPVHWTYTASSQGENEYVLNFTAEIDKGWYLYSQHLDEGGPIPTSFHFEEATGVVVAEEVKENGAFVEGYDDMFAMNIRKYKERAEFSVLVTSEEKDFQVKGYLEFMTCDDNKCLPPVEVEFSFDLKE